MYQVLPREEFNSNCGSCAAARRRGGSSGSAPAVAGLDQGRAKASLDGRGRAHCETDGHERGVEARARAHSLMMDGSERVYTEGLMTDESADECRFIFHAVGSWNKWKVMVAMLQVRMCGA